MKNLIPIILLLFISCSKDNNKKNASVEQANIDISLKDANGVDLLGNNTYLFSNINIKYLVNGNITTPTFEGTQPLFLNDANMPIRIRVFMNNDSSEEYPITYINWNSNDTDTIKAHFIRGNSNGEDYLSFDKVWINNNLVSTYENPGHFIKLIK